MRSQYSARGMDATSEQPTVEQADERGSPLATVAGDQCASCGAHLMPDQRYCLRCGQRRGRSDLPEAQAGATPPSTTSAPAPPARPPRSGGAAALIAGVGTLLLAMGVGVLIGRSSEKTAPSRASAPVQVVTVGGGARPAARSAPAPAPGRTLHRKPHRAKANVTRRAKAKATPRARTKVEVIRTKSPSAAVVSKHLKGANIKLPPKAVVHKGTPGHGPGYQHGKFTGNFFGGGG